MCSCRGSSPQPQTLMCHCMSVGSRVHHGCVPHTGAEQSRTRAGPTWMQSCWVVRRNRKGKFKGRRDTKEKVMVVIPAAAARGRHGPREAAGVHWTPRFRMCCSSTISPLGNEKGSPPKHLPQAGLLEAGYQSKPNIHVHRELPPPKQQPSQSLGGAEHLSIPRSD